MIKLQNIHVVFSPHTLMEKKALKKISLTIKEGEFITVIGSNGAGKSTLLSTIAGETLPTAGKIFIDQEDVTKTPNYGRAGLVSRIFQDPLVGSCGDLTIAENMALASYRGKKRDLKLSLCKNLRQKFTQQLNAMGLGLEKRLDTHMAMLSGGQRQVVSLLMATISPLKILLLDEHTAALDPRTAELVMELTNKIVSEKSLTAMMVTHSLHQALQYGTRTIMLHEGHIIADISGQQRKNMSTHDLMDLFGQNLDDDRLMLQ